MIDTVFYTLGELQSFNSLLATQRSKVQIIDSDSKVIETIPRTSHDQVLLQGILQAGGVLSIHQRGGPPFKTTPGLIWRMYGETGEIEVTADTSYPHLGCKAMEIRIHDFHQDKVSSVDWTANNDFPPPVADIASIYEAFAQGSGYADWSDAVQRHRMIDEVYKSHEESRVGNYMC